MTKKPAPKSQRRKPLTKKSRDRKTIKAKGKRVAESRFNKEYKLIAKEKLKEKDIKPIRKLPRELVKVLRNLALKADAEYVAGLDLENEGTTTKLSKMVLVKGQEFEADTDEVFDFEMMFHNHILSKDGTYVNFVPSPDDFMNVTLNKPHVVVFQDKKTKKPRFILLRSIRDRTPTLGFFDKRLKNLALDINEQHSIHEDPKEFKRIYKKKLNDLGFDFTYFDPHDTFIIYRNKKSLGTKVKPTGKKGGHLKRT